MISLLLLISSRFWLCFQNWQWQKHTNNYNSKPNFHISHKSLAIKIVYSVERKGDKVYFYVDDSGIQIWPKEQGVIVAKYVDWEFFQSSNSTLFVHMNVGSSILHNCKIVVQTHTFATCQLTTAKIDSFEVEKNGTLKASLHFYLYLYILFHFYTFFLYLLFEWVWFSIDDMQMMLFE